MKDGGKMQIEVDEIIEIPDYRDSERNKLLKNEVYALAKSGKPFDMQDLPSAEYKYYGTMYQIFKRLISKEITPEQATAENDKAYYAFTNEQTIYNQRCYNLIAWNDNIKKSEAARIKIHKAENKAELVDAIAECLLALTGDKTLLAKIQTLKGERTE